MKYLFAILFFFSLSIVNAQEHSASPIRLVVFGADSQAGQEYIQELKKRPDVVLTALVGKDLDTISSLGIPVLGEEKAWATLDFDAALIASEALPEQIVDDLLSTGKYIIKEGPLAATAEKAHFYQELIHSQNLPPIFTISLREFMPAFEQAMELLPLLGKPLSFRYEYTTSETINIYPIIHTIQNFFGMPQSVQTEFGPNNNTSIHFDFGPDIQGTLLLNSHPAEREMLYIDGPDATLTIAPNGYQFIYHSTSSLSFFEYRIETLPFSKAEVIGKMFDLSLSYRTKRDDLQRAFLKNVKSVEIIKDIYR